jgi:hypothetical protein
MILTYAGVRDERCSSGDEGLSTDQVEHVRRRVKSLLRHLSPRLVVGAAAAGSDLIIAREAQVTGCQPHVVLAESQEEFKRVSVKGCGDEWEQSYGRLLDDLPSDRKTIIDGPAGAGDFDASFFHSMNGKIINCAQDLAEGDEKTLALVVQPKTDDHEPDDVTIDFRDRAERRGILCLQIDPTVRPEDMQRVFVAMPYGKKHDPTRGRQVNCDDIFDRLLVPVLEDADYEWERADEQVDSGAIHVAMFKALYEADLVIADTITRNANVFYELGLRHVLADASTLLVGPEGTSPPFDVNFVRHVFYPLSGTSLSEEEAVEGISTLRDFLDELDTNETDSPIYQWFQVNPRPDIKLRDARRETDEMVLTLSNKLSRAGQEGGEELAEVAAAIDAAEIPQRDERRLRLRLGSIALELGNYAKAHEWLGRLEFEPGEHLYADWCHTKALALQRQGREADENDEDPDRYWSRAQQVLDQLFEHRRGNSETYGLAGGIAKRRAMRALRMGEDHQGYAQLRRSIDFYQRGMEHDPSDFYVGINLVSLSRLYVQHVREQGDYRNYLKRCMPVVEYYVERVRGRDGEDFWTEVTKAELMLTHHCLGARDVSREEVVAAYFQALAVPHPDDWETSVLDQLQLFRLAGDPVELLAPLLDRLTAEESR